MFVEALLKLSKSLQDDLTRQLLAYDLILYLLDISYQLNKNEELVKEYEHIRLLANELLKQRSQTEILPLTTQQSQKNAIKAQQREREIECIVFIRVLTKKIQEADSATYTDLPYEEYDQLLTKITVYRRMVDLLNKLLLDSKRNPDFVFPAVDNLDLFRNRFGLVASLRHEGQKMIPSYATYKTEKIYPVIDTALYVENLMTIMLTHGNPVIAGHRVNNLMLLSDGLENSLSAPLKIGHEGIQPNQPFVLEIYYEGLGRLTLENRRDLFYAVMIQLIPLLNHPDNHLYHYSRKNVFFPLPNQAGIAFQFGEFEQKYLKKT